VTRPVDVSDAFLRQVTNLFPPARSDRPSRDDFLAHELLRIHDVFADRWHELPETAAGPEFRRFISVGYLVPMLSVVGRLRPDGVVELVTLAVDFEGLPEPDED
jgi:hypothetical protein